MNNDSDDDFSYDAEDMESEEYGTDSDGEEGQEGAVAQSGDGLHRGKTLRQKRKKRHHMAAQAEWAKMPTTWDQVDLESDMQFFDLVEGEAEENRLNQKNEAE